MASAIDDLDNASVPNGDRQPGFEWRWLPGLLVGVLVLCSLGHLISPAQVPVARDLTVFHLPLRQALETAWTAGVRPEWNPAINGGQPILSNPNYAAFYPPTWTLLATSVPFSLNLLILLHVGWGFWGCQRLLRRLGTGSTAALAGGVSFALSPFYLGLSGTFNFFCGMAWWPWVLVAGRAALDGPSHRWRATSLTAAALAVQLLAGEPVAVLISALSLACLATAIPTTPSPRMLGGLGRLAVVGVLAGLLASVLLIPTAVRVANSPRSGALEAEELTVWSLAPSRLPELGVPRLWGDPVRDEEGLYFGWSVHDRAYPYVLSLYIGLGPFLLAILALTARWPIPYRRAWFWMVLVGGALSLGRHLPLLGPVYTELPFLGWIRYPEKFIVLAVAGLVFAGALALDLLLREPQRCRWLERLAFLAAGSYAVLFLVLVAQPSLLGRYIAKFGDPTTASDLAAPYLKQQILIAATLATALGLATVALRRRQGATPRARRLAPWAMLIVVCADLGYYTNGLLPTLPKEQVFAPPEALHELPPIDRIAVAPAGDTEALNLAIGPAGFRQTLGRLRQFDPYSANLWGVDYVLNRDFDQMLTPWGALARQQFELAAGDRATQHRLAEAWSATRIVERKTREEILGDYQASGSLPSEVRLFALPNASPRLRAPMRAVTQSTEGALPRLPLEADQCLEPWKLDAAPPTAVAPEVLAFRDLGSEIEFEYRSREPAYLVLTSTFDSGWSAELSDGVSLPTCPTALGQLGLSVPAGRHLVRLRYRDPWVPVGASVSLLTLCCLLVAGLRARSRSAA